MTATTEERQQQHSSVIQVSGIADVDDDRGFLRVAGYRRSPGDVTLTRAQVRQYGLRKGDLVQGTATPRGADGSGKPTSDGSGKAAGSGGRGNSSRYRSRDRDGVMLTSVERINGLPPEEVMGRPEFDDLTPVYPNQRFRLEAGDTSATARIIDLVSPIGKGQRGLIVAPPKAGKTMVLKTIAHAIASAYPEVHLMLVLVGERPAWSSCSTR